MSSDRGPCFGVVQSAAIGVAVAFVGVATYGIIGALWRRLFGNDKPRRIQ